MSNGSPFSAWQLWMTKSWNETPRVLMRMPPLVDSSWMLHLSGLCRSRVIFFGTDFTVLYSEQAPFRGVWLFLYLFGSGGNESSFSVTLFSRTLSNAFSHCVQLKTGGWLWSYCVRWCGLGRISILNELDLLCFIVPVWNKRNIGFGGFGGVQDPPTEKSQKVP